MSEVSRNIPELETLHGTRDFKFDGKTLIPVSPGQQTPVTQPAESRLLESRLSPNGTRKIKIVRTEADNR